MGLEVGEEVVVVWEAEGVGLGLLCTREGSLFKIPLLEIGSACGYKRTSTMSNGMGRASTAQIQPLKWGTV